MKTYPSKFRVLLAVLLVAVLFALSGCPFGSGITLKRTGGDPVGHSVTLASDGTLSLQAVSVSSEDVFTWLSSNPAVAKVDSSGLVTAVAPGTAIITVTGSASLGFSSVTIHVTAGTSGEGEGETESEPIQLTPFSGRYGYALEGPYGFVGTLTKEQLTDTDWKLEGDFNFPTAGYTVEEPVGFILESYPEQVRISIGVTPPGADTMVAQVITPEHVSMNIAASNEATFKIVVITR